MKRFSILRRGARRHTLAQAMVEFALVLPIVMLVLVGVIEFSRLFYAWLIVENSTRFGVRLASTGAYNPAYCQDGADAGSAGCEGDGETDEVDAARIPTIEDETRRIIVGLHYRYNEPGVTEADDEYLNVTVCSDHEESDAAPPIAFTFTPPQLGGSQYAQCDASEHPGEPGDRVFVATDYNFRFIVLPIFGIEPAAIHLAAYREGVVEQFRVSRLLVLPTPEDAVVLTNTPTVTFTPSETPTPTFTYTPTASPSNTATPTITATPTRTNTPTVTPQPSCSLIVINQTRFRSDRFEARVINNNVQPAYLINSTLTWDLSYAPVMYLDFFRFGTTAYFNPPNNPPPPQATSSPIAASAPALELAGAGTQMTWAAKFNNPTFIGLYRVTLTFDFPGWGTCVLTTSLFNNSPTPSLTPSITRTPSKTLTPSITFTPSKTFTPRPTRTPRPTQEATNTPREPTATRRPPTATTRPPVEPTETRRPSPTPTRRPATPTAPCPEC